VTRRRLDDELVRRGLVSTLSEAREAIGQGVVTVAGRTLLKPGSLVGTADPVAVLAAARPYVSRGGEKLAAALDRLRLDPAGRRCMDAGASTGGFTDVLLARGAAAVAAVDVGYGQLAWPLREDPRVTVLERTNVRTLAPEDLPFRPDLIVADLSFISLTAVIPTLAAVAASHADLLLLVKPQFESRPDDVERGGVVRDPAIWGRALERVAEACRAAKLGPMAVTASALPGPAGNVEFFLHARRGAAPRSLDLAAALAEGEEVRAS
jgi:23S rRNA (cytidine1920-2'-O)/16S rRNA (cytidine1409-2'-O)-methyltransferase